jgi:hypothetical protein
MHPKPPEWRDTATGFAQLAEAIEPLRLGMKTSQSPAFRQLTAQKIVERAPDATTIFCRDCKANHDVETTRSGGRQVICRDGPVFIRDDEVERWRCNPRNLALLLRGQLKTGGQRRSSSAGFVFSLGALGSGADGFPVWLVRGFSSHPFRQRALVVLAKASPTLPGVIISSGRWEEQIQLPYGSNAVWMGDVFRFSDGGWSLDVDEIYRRAPNARATGRDRGRPKKQGDPVALFLERVASDEALRDFRGECDAIHRRLAARHGKDSTYAPSSVVRMLGVTFKRWEAFGFPVNFRK